jgi:hypothetical protein
VSLLSDVGCSAVKGGKEREWVAGTEIPHGGGGLPHTIMWTKVLRHNLHNLLVIF